MVTQLKTEQGQYMIYLINFFDFFCKHVYSLPFDASNTSQTSWDKGNEKLGKVWTN